MKREINLKRFIGGLFVFLLSIVALVGCNKWPAYSNYDEAEMTEDDSVTVFSYVEALTNPSFGSLSEIQAFRNRLVEDCAIDEAFKTMPEEVLTNVSTVCLKKFGFVTKKEIVMEYRANSQVYDNLVADNHVKNKPEKPENKDTATEGQQLPVPISTSFHYEIDTVDGKPVKRLIKEERYESK